jgi:putative membrane protein insertion efficiency factor
MSESEGPPSRLHWWDRCDCDCGSAVVELAVESLGVCGLPCGDLLTLSSLLLLLSRFTRTGKASDRAVIGAIKAYRRVSPRLPTRCRYTPTCSAYGLEAVRRHGSREGLRLAARRIARCRPGIPYGTPDPVP